MQSQFKIQSKKANMLIRLLTFTSTSREEKETALRGKIHKQRMYRILPGILFISMLLPYAVQAQVSQPKTGRSAITVGYFGETITHPGLFAGYEYNLRPQHRYQLLLTMNLGGYVHKRNHTGLFSEIGIGQRLNFRSGFLLEQFIGVGYLHTFLNGGPVYEVTNDGAVSKSSNLGRSHLMPSVSLGFGWNIAHSDKLPLMLFIRPKVFWQYPFNGYALPHAALQVGITKVIR